MITAVDWHLSGAEWAEALAQCPDATYFHTQHWQRVLARSFGSRPIAARIQLDRDRWALLHLTVRPLARGLVPLALGGETGAYNGLVSPTPLEQEEVDAIYQFAMQRFPNLWLIGNPFARQRHLPCPTPPVRFEELSTHALALRPLEELRQGFSRGCKARGNKARKQGFEVIRTHDPALAGAFAGLYEDSVRRWGEKLTWARPARFFEEVLRASGEMATLFLAVDGGRPVSGLLFVGYGQTVHYLAGATEAEVLPRCPSNLLMEESMGHFAACGFRLFDFGPSNGLEGVSRFKESFGARPVPFASCHYTNRPGQLYFAARTPYEQARRWLSQSLQTLKLRRDGAADGAPSPEGA